MKIIFVEISRDRKKEFETYFERMGYEVSFHTDKDFRNINSDKLKNSNVVILGHDNIKDAEHCFDISLSFAKNVLLLKENYTHQWYRLFHKKGIFDFLKFSDGIDEIATAISNSFKEVNPFYKNKLLERERSLLKVVKDVCLILDFFPLLNLIIDTLMDFSGSSNAILYVRSDFVGDKEIKRGQLKYQNEIEKQILSDLKELKKRKKAFVKEKEDKIYLELPVYCENEVHGIAVLEIEKENFKNEIIFVCENFLNEISPALRNSLDVEKTKKLTTIDDLTTCFNRRFFDEYIKIILDNSKKNKKKFSLIFMDLDNLKDVNTKYGHLVGSQILKVVAEKTIEAVRGVDKVCRFGGDEFCVILPDTDTKGAIRVAERIRENITKNEYFLKDYPDVKITASFGISTYPDHGKDVESLIKVADNAMYMVKMTSKNAIFAPEAKENGG